MVSSNIEPQASMEFNIETSELSFIVSRSISVLASMPCRGDRISWEMDDIKSDLAFERADISSLLTSAVMEFPNADM
jgi:hypothetical protein